jgi:SRP40, C-terminal domain
MPVDGQGSAKTSKKPVHNLRPVSDSDSSESEEGGHEKAADTVQTGQTTVISIGATQGSMGRNVSITTGTKGKGESEEKKKQRKEEGKREEPKEEKKARQKSKTDKSEAKADKKEATTADEDEASGSRSISKPSTRNDNANVTDDDTSTNSSPSDPKDKRDAYKKRKAPTESDNISQKKTRISGVTIEESLAPSTHMSNGMHKDRKKRIQNQPFRRIKVEEITITNERLKDNSFMAKVTCSVIVSIDVLLKTEQDGSEGDYGQKAAHDLIVTRGDGFRKVG